MRIFGEWILLSFVIYYVLALWMRRDYAGCLFMGAILSLGIVLTFN